MIGRGMDAAKSVYENKKYSYIENSDIGQDVLKSKYTELKYLGKLGEHLFLSPLDNTKIIIVDEKGLQPLILIQHYK